jgi:hypothetical protein
MMKPANNKSAGHMQNGGKSHGNGNGGGKGKK